MLVERSTISEPATPPADREALTVPEIAILSVADVGGALVLCDDQGCVVGGSPSGRALLTRMGMQLEPLPAPLLPELWAAITSRAVGEAVQWRAGGHDPELLLGCTRYRLSSDGWLLVMKEISRKQNMLAQRLHQQRLEALGRLIATTAHDLRSPLASIVFNSDALANRLGELSPERIREMAVDVNAAATRLRGAIDCLLDYVRLGPQRPSSVSLREILTRVQSLLRPQLRAGGHMLLVSFDDGDERVLGNPLAVEQIFVNLVLNAIEAAHAPITVRVATRLEEAHVRVLVEDDGPGIRPEHRLQVFDPFFTTKRDGTGIGLTSARDAARAAGGDLQLVRWQEGAAFAVLLPCAGSEP